MSKFMTTLEAKIREGKAEITTKQYMSRLKTLNGNTDFTSLTFLKDIDKVKDIIKDKAEGTRLSYYTAINNALVHFPSYKKLYATYSDMVRPMWESFNKQRASHVKSEKQEGNVVPANDIITVRDSLRTDVAKFIKRKTISDDEYDKLMQYVLISLYTYIPPRRNQDYSYMYVAKKALDKYDDDKNYILLKEKQFVFNKYKTSKHYGQQYTDIPDELMNILTMFIKRNPNYPTLRAKGNNTIKLLVKQDGTDINETNGITRLLNKAFGKNIGSTAIRHIYLSDKYADNIKEREKDAKAMAHTTDVQSEYIKF